MTFLTEAARTAPPGEARLSMDVDDCNGSSYISGAASGESSVEREFPGAPGVPSASTPNSQHTSPSRSLSANSIKVELYSDDEPGRGGEEDGGEDGGPDHGGEGGGAYREMNHVDAMTSGATRLPNGKLKCDICGMICIGPNVLMVHKRSHTVSSPTVGKPYKCSYCGRSYKQQSTLEEHRERCHSYLQSLETLHPASTHLPGEELRFTPDSVLQPPSDQFLDGLTSNFAKRKRSTPQRFVGQKHMRLNMADAPYELSAAFEKDGDLNPAHLETPHFPGLGGDYAAAPGGGGGGDGGGGGGDGGGGLTELTEQPAPPRGPPSARPLRLSELRPLLSSAHRAPPPPQGARLDCMGGGGTGGREAAEGHEDLPSGRSGAPSPSNGCQDSTDTESLHDEPQLLHHHHHHNNNLHYSGGPGPAPPPHHRARGRPLPGHAKDAEREEAAPPGGHAFAAAQPTPGSPAAPSSTSREALRVVDGDGRAVRSFRCEHCRVLFLDHVMFTIHMGAHGFRQPFECNICGHRSQDRYEFSSHIVRGEHLLE
ncbi:zinc finger protein Eos-like isoform X8 [Gadus chalcogrammus]|uniref:zinc finger protein Eos-like isoform X8 n=1 Tax=Gadus chalcogrammus TaxID=1042646 RepID=UPI0024C4D83E|nr:zinc finger protein Eos-like isoform X8 [Gadus chalcogrammus]